MLRRRNTAKISPRNPKNYSFRSPPTGLYRIKPSVHFTPPFCGSSFCRPLSLNSGGGKRQPRNVTRFPQPPPPTTGLSKKKGAGKGRFPPLPAAQLEANQIHPPKLRLHTVSWAATGGADLQGQRISLPASFVLSAPRQLPPGSRHYLAASPRKLPPPPPPSLAAKIVRTPSERGLTSSPASGPETERAPPALTGEGEGVTAA